MIFIKCIRYNNRRHDQVNVFSINNCYVTDPIDEPFSDAPGPKLRLPFVASKSARHGGHKHGSVVQQSRVSAQRLPTVQSLLSSPSGNAAVLVARVNDVWLSCSE